MKHINLRIDDALHARLVELADADQRSINKEILWIIAQHLSSLDQR